MLYALGVSLRPVCFLRLSEWRQSLWQRLRDWTSLVAQYKYSGRQTTRKSTQIVILGQEIMKEKTYLSCGTTESLRFLLINSWIDKPRIQVQPSYLTSQFVGYKNDQNRYRYIREFRGIVHNLTSHLTIVAHCLTQHHQPPSPSPTAPPSSPPSAP
jgi:hypothetical protein